MIGIVDDIPLKIKPRDVEIIQFGGGKLRAAIFRTFCSEKLYKEEAANKNDRSTIRLGGKTINDEHKTEYFRNMKWF